MMINAIEEAVNNKLSELGSASNYAATKALLQQRSAYAAAGEIAARTLPLFKNVIEALSYAFFIFIVILALVAQWVPNRPDLLWNIRLDPAVGASLCGFQSDHDPLWQARIHGPWAARWPHLVEFISHHQCQCGYGDFSRMVFSQYSLYFLWHPQTRSRSLRRPCPTFRISHAECSKWCCRRDRLWQYQHGKRFYGNPSLSKHICFSA